MKYKAEIPFFIRQFSLISIIALMTFSLSCSTEEVVYLPTNLGRIIKQTNVPVSKPHNNPAKNVNPSPKPAPSVNTVNNTTSQDKVFVPDNKNTQVLSRTDTSLEMIFSEAELKTGIKDYTKGDIEKTVDGNGYKRSYKKDKDSGDLILKNGTDKAYWVHNEFYKDFVGIEGNGLFVLGYPLVNEAPIFPQQLKPPVIKQTFEGGAIYLITDDERAEIYPDSTIVKTLQDCKKVDKVNYSFVNYQFPMFSKKSTGRDGDPINMIFLVKDKQQLQDAFKSAGWIDPAFGWENLPVSNLEVWGRKQDLAYARETSDWYKLYRRRHHIRLWKSDLKEGNSEVWIAGATEDIDVKLKDKELRNEEKSNQDPDKSNPFTHAIDQDTDKEREYVGRTIREKIPALKSSYIRPAGMKDGIIETLNGGLDLVIWDGRVLIIDLANT